MNGAHFDKKAAFVQKLAEIANEICCQHVQRTGFAPGIHDFEERFAPIVRTELLHTCLNEQLFNGEGESRRKRMRELLLELERGSDEVRRI
jgi:hypothetical protein